MQYFHTSKRFATGAFIAVIITISALGIAVRPAFLFAQTSPADAKAQVDQKRAQLEAELAQIEKDIAVQRAIVEKKQSEGASISRDISILNAQIAKAQLVIRERDIVIGKLSEDITGKTRTIETLSAKMERERVSLAQLLRKTDELDSYSVAEMVLGGATLSQFFSDMDAFNMLNQSIHDSLAVVSEVKQSTETEKQVLAEKKAAELDAKMAKEAEKRAVQRSEAEKKSLLTITKNQEKAYKKVLAEREAQAARIRSTLFALRDSAAIPFGDALDFATAASKSTGVRPAFILAILTQETNLGENIGSCYLKDVTTGSGVGKNTGKVFSNVMKPSRDVGPFIALLGRLGLDPFTTPISCPQGGGGYGGAMGPSQFIPSTWISFESRIRSITGNNPPSPWNPKDAITATTIYLDDLGAGRGGYSAERQAALRYYAGGNWNSPKNAFYADGNSYSPGVMKTAQKIQETMIDPLQNY